MCGKPKLRRKQDFIRPHLLKRNSSQAVRTHKAHRGSKNNGKTKKKQHARIPAQVPASSVTRNPGGNNRQEWKDAVSGQKDGTHQADNRVCKTGARGGKRRTTVRSSAMCGGKRQWCLGSEEPIVPSHAWQNDVKASVGGTWQISPFRHMLLVGAFVLDGTNGYHEKIFPRIVRKTQC